MTLNDICDYAGIAAMCSGFSVCGVLLISGYSMIQKRTPCEIRVTQQREEYLYANLHTALLNFINTGFFAFVQIIWKVHELDTAPNHVDVMILMLVVMSVVTFVRSSVCAKLNIRKLLHIRITDTECGECGECKYRRENEHT